MDRIMRNTNGFTLMELAMVLVILSLLLIGMLVPLTAQLEQQRVADTDRYLEQIKEALIGFAVANRRLPCPATATSEGRESFAAGGDAANGKCSNFTNGFLPAATLGVKPVDDQGFAVDAWNAAASGRIRYAVYPGTINGVVNPLTRSDGIKNATMNSIAAAPNLIAVCASATGITATNCGTARALALNAPFVVYSLGRNGAAAAGGTGPDETANLNGDSVFVSHTQSILASNTFDDIVTWPSLNTLFGRMLVAGALP
jgi:prepilin-type N-terminal cleavage/methylation domain-containing protein